MSRQSGLAWGGEDKHNTAFISLILEYSASFFSLAFIFLDSLTIFPGWPETHDVDQASLLVLLPQCCDYWHTL